MKPLLSRVPHFKLFQEFERADLFFYDMENLKLENISLIESILILGSLIFILVIVKYILTLEKI